MRVIWVWFPYSSLCRWRLHFRLISKILILILRMPVKLELINILLNDCDVKPCFRGRALCFYRGRLRRSCSRGWVYKWRRKVAATLTAEGRGWRGGRAERERGRRMRGGKDSSVCVCVCVLWSHVCIHTQTKCGFVHLSFSICISMFY